MSVDPVWINGSLSGAIDPFDRGLLLGDGVFDTLVAFRRIPFAGRRHLERLQGQAEAIGIPLDAERVRAGWEVVLAAADADDLVLRTTVTRGSAARGLWPESPPSPTLLVAATPWNASHFAQPARLVTSAIPRNPGSPASRLKTLGYLDNILAAREAAERGADDALFLTPVGNVACTTIANIFAVSGDRIVTPPPADGVLPGTMRAMVLEVAASVGLRAAEASIGAPDLHSAGAAFLTNSVRFFRPVASLDGRAMSSVWTPALEALATAIAAEVRRECRFELPGLPSAFGPGGESAKLKRPAAGRPGAAY